MALDNVNREIVEKWEDMLRMFNCGTEEKKKRDNLVLSSDSHFNLSALDQSSAKSVERDASITISDSAKQTVECNSPIERSKRSTEDFIRELSPMLADLGEMIEKLNMNDPTRV